jgi:hypothetical protein
MSVGMLESSSLLVRPAAEVSATNLVQTTRLILDPQTRLVVGRVRRHLPGSRWRRWLWPTTLAVHEAEDDPLLFTLRRYWWFGSRWCVDDAEGRGVGYIRRRVVAPGQVGPAGSGPGVIHEVLTILHHYVAVYPSHSAEHAVGYIRAAEGVELARVLRTADSDQVSFTSVVGENPLLKMLLLAAVLVNNQ